MRSFVLNRIEDKTGISGTGVVAEGVIFSRGKVALCWLTNVTSIVLYDDIESVEKIHGHGGATQIQYLDPAS